jgi:hypothetical protein
MPFGTSKTNLVPTVTVSAAASVSPTSGTAQDFTSPKTYTVTAEDGSTQDYVVTVNNLKNTEKQITAFTIAGQVSSAIDQAAKTVTVTMPFGTNRTNLAPTVTVSAAASLSPHIGHGAGFHFAKNLHGDGGRWLDARLCGDGQQPEKHREADYIVHDRRTGVIGH